jgi:hypothetical protein
MQLQKSNKACATGAGRWSLVASPHVYTLRILKSQNILDHFSRQSGKKKARISSNITNASYFNLSLLSCLLPRL